MAASPVRASQWSQEAYTIARQARSLNFLKVEPLIKTLQKTSGRSRRDCVLLIHQCVQEKIPRRSWTEEEIDQVRELLVANPVEVVAKKIGRTPSSVKHLCSRVGIRSRELRCDLFSVTGLAAAIHVRPKSTSGSSRDGWKRLGMMRQGPVPTRFLPRPFSAACASIYPICKNATFAVRTY